MPRASSQRGIDHVDGLVTDCDLDHRRLTVEHSADGTRREIYAATLVWATGLRYPKPPLPGLDRAEENTTASGLLSLVARLAEPGRRVVVVGAGLIGTETAATLASAHDVTLVDMLDRPLARFLPRVSDAASATLEALGVGFLGSCAIEAVRCGRRCGSRAHLDAMATSSATSSSRRPASARACCPSSPGPMRGRSRLLPTSSCE